MNGIMDSRLQMFIPLRVHGRDGLFADVIAQIDTGFDGSLSLPLEIVQRLNLRQAFSDKVRLADGSFRFMDYYRAVIAWSDKIRITTVMCSEGNILLGTEMLQGFRAIADFIVHGEWKLERLPRE